MYVLPERPMNVFQVIKHACIFWAKTLYKVLPLTMLYGLLMAIVPAEQFPHPALKALISFLCSLLGLMVLVAVYVRMNGELTGRPIQIGNAISIGLKRCISIIYWYFIIFLIAGLPTILLFFLGFFLQHPFNNFVYLLIPLYILIAFVYLYASFPLIAAEDVIATTAVKQSYQLVKQQWWHTFFIAVLTFGILIIPEGILYKLHLSNNILAMFILMAFFSSFACGISLIQLYHLRAYHKINGSLSI